MEGVAPTLAGRYKVRFFDFVIVICKHLVCFDSRGFRVYYWRLLVLRDVRALRVYQDCCIVNVNGRPSTSACTGGTVSQLCLIVIEIGLQHKGSVFTHHVRPFSRVTLREDCVKLIFEVAEVCQAQLSQSLVLRFLIDLLAHNHGWQLIVEASAYAMLHQDDDTHCIKDIDIVLVH